MNKGLRTGETVITYQGENHQTCLEGPFQEAYSEGKEAHLGVPSYPEVACHPGACQDDLRGVGEGKYTGNEKETYRMGEDHRTAAAHHNP